MLAVLGSVLFGVTTDTFAQKAPLIRLQVQGSEEIAGLIAEFLTENGLFLVDDDYAPRLVVIASERKEGTRLNKQVTYAIESLQIHLSDPSRYLSFRGKTATESGTLESAVRNARSLLKQYLREDEGFLAALGQIPGQEYYEIERAGESAEIRLTAIEGQLSGLIAERAHQLRLIDELEWIRRGNITLTQAVRNLAERIDKGGTSRISESAITQMLQHAEPPYVFPSSSIPRDETKYRAIGAIVIMVPLDNGQKLSTGRIRIFTHIEKVPRVVYKKTPEHFGPRVFNSLDRAETADVIGRYLKAPGNHLAITAKRYLPNDLIVYISQQDAEDMHLSSQLGVYLESPIHGQSAQSIFNDGRIALIPVYQ